MNENLVSLLEETKLDEHLYITTKVISVGWPANTFVAK